MKKSGFTLVELSIVLVAVGLMIGGVLVGQSLIQAAKLTGFVQQMQQYDIAAGQFKRKFKKVAGDSGMLYYTSRQGACIGPGDGIITDDDCANNDAVFEAGHIREIGAFWFDLAQLTGLKIENCARISNSVPYAASGIETPQVKGPRCNTPEAKIQKNVSILAAARMPWSVSEGNAFYVIDMTEYTGAGYMSGPKASISQQDASAYDNKVDDGVPNSGEVYGGIMNSAQLNLSAYTYPATYSGSSTQNMVIIQNMSSNK